MYRLQSLDYTGSKTIVGNPVAPTAKETQDPSLHPMPSRMSTHWHPQQTGKWTSCEHRSHNSHRWHLFIDMIRVVCWTAETLALCLVSFAIPKYRDVDLLSLSVFVHNKFTIRKSGKRKDEFIISLSFHSVSAVSFRLRRFFFSEQWSQGSQVLVETPSGPAGAELFHRSELHHTSPFSNDWELMANFLRIHVSIDLHWSLLTSNNFNVWRL